MSERTWGANAVAYELMAITFRYPESTLVEALVSGEYLESLKEVSEVLGIELSQGELDALTQYHGLDTTETLHKLRIEATRLFVGSPNPAISPFEGIWRAKDDGVEPLLFVNPHSMAVERLYRSCGLGQSEGKNEPLDHVATELEFLQYISMLAAEMIEPEAGVSVPEGGWAAVHDNFLEEHFKVWVPRFADKVAEESCEPFYKTMGAILQKLV